MTVMNRNVITADDVAALSAGKRLATLDVRPPAGGPSSGTGGPNYQTDDYLTRLLKFVPLEVLGTYLFAEGLVRPNTDGAEQRTWLLCLLVAAVAVSVPYSRLVLGVVRPAQLVAGAVGLLVYIFATGGWFTTLTWYEQWQGSFALGVFALLVTILRLPVLPEVSQTAATGDPQQEGVAQDERAVQTPSLQPPGR